MFTLVHNGEYAHFRSGERNLRVAFPAAAIARITCTDSSAFLDRPSRIVTAVRQGAAFSLAEDAATYTLKTAALTVILSKETGALRYFDRHGKLLVREPDGGGKWLTRKAVTRNEFARDSVIVAGQNIDGARAKALAYETVFDREAFEAKLELVFAEGEALFGLGSHEEGYGNLRGRSRELYQQTMKAVVPHLVSTRGYGLLLDCCSLMTFHDDALGSYWWADVVEELDFYILHGESFEALLHGYRQLTGAVPLPPKWAFGFVQSKERYVTAAEMVEVVEEYRHREVPLDAIVLDWKSWPNGAGWGQKSFDPTRFPDPAAFVDALHARNAKLMVSIWPIMTGGCENQRELLERDLMLGNQSTYNAFRPEARACYWEQTQRGLFAHGVDAWWCDCTEPFEADWTGAVKPEAHLRLALNTQEAKLYLDAADLNAFSLLHSQGIYKGQRKAQRDLPSGKRVLNLTRSSYAGQARYGTFSWNGDVSATWETLRRCIPEGVNFCATGEPYWTVDAGGFFVANDPALWFWSGDYGEGCRGLTDRDALQPDAADTGCRDLGFWELYTRWLQYAAFLPMFRSHGTDAAREIWRFGESGSLFYDAIAACIRLRYCLLPYIYSLAAAVTFRGAPMIRAVALEFPDDRQTYDLLDQYLFGPSLMVCPVTEPMYFGQGSSALAHVVNTRAVYLPAGTGWFDFWTGERHAGGQNKALDASLPRLPLLVREGSILPLTEVMQYVDQRPDAPYEIRVYAGRDAEFMLYEDHGDGYGYEQGECAWITLTWREESGELVIGARSGSFGTSVEERDYTVRFFSEAGVQEQTVRYTGQELRLTARRDDDDKG